MPTGKHEHIKTYNLNQLKEDILNNNLDVLPFVEAIEKMKEFYKLKRLDIFKDGVSLPGLVLKYLIKSTDSEFYLFDEEDKITKEDKQFILFIKR